MTARIFRTTISLQVILTAVLTLVATDMILTRALSRTLTLPEDKNPPLSSSAFTVPGVWTNEKGVEIKMTAFLGKPAIIALFYTSCRTICPMTVNNLKRVEKALGEQAKDVQFILVSIDPSQDTAEKLNSFVKTHDLDTTRWHVITSHEDRVRRLAGTLDLGFGHKAADTDLHYMHSQRFTIVDGKGFPQDTISTMEPDIERAQRTLLAIRTASTE